MQLIATKLYIPPATADYVPRPHLIRKLGLISSHKLTILSAPAGFGKTTLLGSWFREINEQTSGIQLCWLSLDDEDNESGRFLDTLLSSLEDTGISLNTVSPLLPITNTTDYRTILDALLQDLSGLSQDVVLIFDDYHIIESREVHRLVRQLISHAPGSFHILISTRTQPPFETSKLRISGELLELGPADLRFSIDETREYIHRALDVAFLERDIVTIAERTEGWIAGLKMAVLAMQKSEDPIALVKRLHGSHRYIFDYLMEQVLAHQPQEVKEFLLVTSVVETFSASLCDALIQEGGYPPGTSQRILTYLEQANLFIVPLDDERQWFRYHHLFAELLRSILEQTSPKRVSTLNGYACNWYESQRMIPIAVSHAIAAGDVERAARMISSNVLLLVEQTELKTVLRRLDALFAGGEFINDLSLKIAHAWVLVFSGESKRAVDILQGLEAVFASETNIKSKQEWVGDLSAIRGYIEWAAGHHRKAVELARQAAKQLSLSNATVRALNLTTLANALSELNEFGEALQVGQEAMDVGNSAGQANIVLLASNSLAYAYRNLGQLRKSTQVCEQALEQAEMYRCKYGHFPPAVSAVYALQSGNLHSQCDFEQAYQYAKRGLAISEMWGQADTKMVASWKLARVLSSKNDPEAALQIVEKAREAGQSASNWYSNLAKFIESEIHFNSGDLKKAKKLILELINPDEPFDPEFSIFYPLCIRILLIENEYNRALKLIDQIMGQPENYKGGYKTQILILQACAYQNKGNEKEAMLLLDEALQLAEPELHLLPFVESFRQLDKLLLNMASKGKYKGFIDRVFSNLQNQVTASQLTASKGIHLDIESPIEPLTEREMEILRLLNSHLPTPEIADMLAVSVNTVRTHIKSIYGKLGVHSRSTAIALSKTLKLLT